MVDRDQRDDQQRHREEGADRPPQPRPEDQREEHRQRVQRQPLAHDRRGDEVPFQRGEGEKQQRRDDRMGERVERHQPDHQQHQFHHQRADIGDEVQQERQNAPGQRIGQADAPRHREGGDTDHRIDDGDDTQIGREIVFDVVEDLEHPQPRLALREEEDHHMAQLRPAEQEEEQRAEEDEYLPHRRRDEDQCRLQDAGEVERQPLVVAFRQHGIAQALQRRDQLIEDVQLLLNAGRDLRSFADPFHRRRGQQRDDRVAERDRAEPQHDGADQRGDADPPHPGGERPEHQPDHECRHGRQQHRPRQIERDDEGDEEHADGRDLRQRAPDR